MSERENELFEEWWENEGQYNRAGGGDYEKTFAYHAWMAVVNRQGYKIVPVEPDEKQWCGLARHLGRYMQMNDRYCPKTLKKYFDRFIGEPPEWLTKEVGNWDSEHAFATADLPVFIYKAMIGAVE